MRPGIHPNLKTAWLPPRFLFFEADETLLDHNNYAAQYRHDFRQ